MRSPYDFASMTALICFEAAARNASFKTAAQEMNVTPAAVSHQIKALEQELGCALFIRRHRGVELTEKGAFLLVALQRGFETISDTVSRLRDRPDVVDVTIRTTTAVSALWLTPKITAFWKIHPDITVSQVISDVATSTSRHDLNIGYAFPGNDSDEWREIFRDRILAYGTPRFAREHGISGIGDLLRAPLIHMSDDNAWTGWADWFHELGHPAPSGRGLLVNNHMIALQAAEDDVGAVLGWEGLMSRVLQGGRLVNLVPESIASPAAFCLRLNPRASAKARLFADWLTGDRI
ncbi:DNA-binding transcriptional regulator, LysR family [Paracoccus halophilus]|uniref:DNA-binding transcriptional regulator, LysR family n=1 Tax=Paracoccus halophilus TaxID=376733 RepID=A0A099F111_9RHOB|nr:LysR family transcriptional regulator [Paracoccus halophilus]KGJ03926.1 LysR family transcriptional regulator [Paracoccus halophilus]SFA56635.1 DNA-binding transcriptional regulator, LysR family [Paracoccus halophilus]